MTENMQADDVQSRQACFVRCCPSFRNSLYYYCRANQNIRIDVKLSNVF